MCNIHTWIVICISYLYTLSLRRIDENFNRAVECDALKRYIQLSKRWQMKVKTKAEKSTWCFDVVSIPVIAWTTTSQAFPSPIYTSRRPSFLHHSLSPTQGYSLSFSLSFSLAFILDLDFCLIPFTYMILSHNSFLSFAYYILIKLILSIISWYYYSCSS